MANPNIPIVNAPNKYVNGLAVSQVGTGILGVAAGAARDSSNTNDIILPGSINGLITRIGVNGLDTGTTTVNTNYAVYLIGDSTGKSATAYTFSLSAISPLLPGGYDIFRRIGWFRTSSSSANLISRYFEFGDGQNRSYYAEDPITFLTGGNATTFTIVNPSTSGASPAVNTELLLDVIYTPASATNTAQFIPANSAVAVVAFGTGVAGAQRGSIRIPAPGGSFRYKVTNAGDSLTLAVSGFTDTIL